MSISVLLFALLFSTLVIFLYYLFNMKLKGKVKNIKILGSEVNTKTLINYFVFVCISEVLFILFLYYIVG
jgi:hypothetical protein